MYQSQLDEDAFNIIQPSLKDALRLVEHACGNEITSKQIILRLLQSDESQIALAAAKGVWHQLKNTVRADSDYYPLWRIIIVQYLDEDWMLSSIFQDDAELAYDWLLKQIHREYPEYYRFGKALPSAIHSLGLAQRKSLLEYLPDDFRHGDLIDQLVNSDVELFKHLLRQNHLREMHLTALPRVTDSLWIEMVLVALDAGYTPEEIAQIVTRPFFGEFLTQGERADRWHSIREAFSTHVNHENELIHQIAAFGQNYAQGELDSIRREERKRAIYGRE